MSNNDRMGDEKLPSYSSSVFANSAESCDNGFCHGGRGWQTDESVDLDENKMFCCGDCGDEWVLKQQQNNENEQPPPKY